jgi:diphosphomevalonate decarboxylase
LDAGPNIHLLYPNSIAKEIELFIDQELKPLCENQFLIKDEVGQGLEIISKSF